MDGAFDQIVKEESARLIRKAAPVIGTVSTCKGGLAPLDIDISPFDNSKMQKEGVKRTYKGVDGFTPILAYLGREGYQVNVEFREGSQHSQKDTVAFLSIFRYLMHVIAYLLSGDTHFVISSPEGGGFKC